MERSKIVSEGKFIAIIAYIIKTRKLSNQQPNFAN